MLLSDFFSFYPVSFSYSMIFFHLEYYVVFSCHISLGYDSFLDFSCFWCFWQFSVGLIRCLVVCPSNGIYLVFLLWLDWGYMFWRGRPQRYNVISITTNQGFQYDLPLLMLILTTWLSVFKTSPVSTYLHLLYSVKGNLKN